MESSMQAALVLGAVPPKWKVIGAGLKLPIAKHELSDACYLG